jgi:hypothetical protein
MKRADVAHIVRAAQALTKEREFVLIGSQAAHLSLERMPQIMEQSGELDIYPLRRPALADLIDGAIGEGSMFHETYGYYAQGVGPETAKLPAGWQERAVRISSPDMDKAIAIAPEIHDICASKAVADRPKDRDYIAAAIAAKIVDPRTLLRRIDMIEGVAPEVITLAKGWISAPDRQGQAER